MSPEYSLLCIRLLHTAVWAVLASATVAIPIAALRGRFRLAGWLTGLILAECIVLAINGARCPLTDVAARYTTDRTANFDIYLPLWLALHNKTVFGVLFVVGEFVWIWKWFEKRGAKKNGVARR